MRKSRILLIGSLAAVLPIASFGAVESASPVADALMNRDMGHVRSLIVQKADVNAAQADGTTALHWAVHELNTEALGLLLKAGANPNAATRLGITPLSLACETGNPEIVQKLLVAGADVNGAFLAQGETPLMMASRSGNLEAVKLLLDAGARVNDKEKLRGTTALLWAAEENHPDVVKFLLAHGADIKATSTVEAPPNGRGRRVKDSKEVKFTDAYTGEPTEDPDAPAAPVPTGGLTALVLAVRQHGVDSVKVLLDSGAPVNQPTADGSTPLLVALQNGDAEIAKLLVDRNADVNQTNMKGWTPLYLAVKARTMETGTMPNPYIDKDAMFLAIESLVTHGAQVNTRLKQNTEVKNAIDGTWLREPGATAFLRASMTGDLKVMKFLLAHGADPKIPTQDGTTSLMALAGVGYSDGFVHDIGAPEESAEAMKVLLDAGVDINAKNYDGVTALHGACHKNFVQGIRLLVEHGADLTARSHRASYVETHGTKGNTALDWATGVQIGMQSSIYHAEAVELVTKLMTDRNIPVEGLSATKGGRASVAK